MQPKYAKGISSTERMKRLKANIITRPSNDDEGAALILYHDLIVNTIDDLLSRAFPIMKSLEKISQIWPDLVKDFIRSGETTTPELWRLPHRFMEFCVQRAVDSTLQMPYLYDLLLFEWTEIELEMAEDPIEMQQTSFLGQVVVSPHRLLKLNYPVFRKDGCSASSKGEYFLLMFRHSSDFSIQCIELSENAALLVEKLCDTPSQVNGPFIQPADAKNFFRQLAERGFISAELLVSE